MRANPDPPALPGVPLAAALPRTVVVLGLVSALNDASSEMITPLLPIFLTATLGAGPAIVGLVEGLAEGDLVDEARAALRDALLPLARALAVEGRLPEPAAVDDALLPPLSHAWKDNAPAVRSFVADASQPLQPLLNSLSKI